MRKPLAGLGVTMAIAAVFGASGGYFMRLDLPDVRALEEYRPAQMTRVLDRDGREIATFAAEKRILLDPAEIPPSFRDALISSEDSEFRKHTGIDFRGVGRAVWTDLRERRKAQGASTLTMQLAGMLFLDRSQKTVRRKLQEAVLAVEIERHYSKQEILALYTNQVHMGHGLQGLGAAARHYFNKPAHLLTIGESATLVGLLPRPSAYSPIHDLERATQRRNLVLRRMVEEGYLDTRTARRVAGERLVLNRPVAESECAEYFVESVRRTIRDEHGERALYAGGLEIRTTMDPRLQEFAEEAIREGLELYAERRRQREGSNDTGEAPQAALVALDPRTGEVLAMVGGSDFGHSEFNRVTQARRQPGSAFKPIVLAAALENGKTLADTLLDEPTVFLDRRNPQPYQPENFSREYFGSITLRTAIEKSANIASVKLLQQVGYDAAIDMALRLGIESGLRPYPSLALGAFELTLLELTSAYGVFANGGMYVEPHWIRAVGDRSQGTVARTHPAVRDAVSPQLAYAMSHALNGVIRRGTGRGAAELPWTLAGKTGTTDDYVDAWFVGYSPELVVGVWVGYDAPQSLGVGESGSKAALPIWKSFMERALEGRDDWPFALPDGVTFVVVDAETGRRAVDARSCEHSLSEVFIEGSEPLGLCSSERHRRLRLPRPFQRYPLGPDGALQIPANELRALVDAERGVSVSRNARRLRYSSEDESVTLRLDTGPDRPPIDLGQRTDLVAGWRGTDGRRANIVWFSTP
ncbi:MAG: PBP1A family penicillin-binding protein [bacterium]|nr:PBP1A family penicillin-binding protein [bacterium]